MENNKFDWRKYVLVFIITGMLFATASYLSSYFGNKKVKELRDIQNTIALDILSSETQYTLLSELSCKNVNYSALSGELAELGNKLEWGEENLGQTKEVDFLRKYYALLQIKDYLLMKKITARCGEQYAFVLYFYTTAENCSECERTGLVLSKLREKYPELRVYSFDYSTELSAVEAMLRIYKIEDTKLPALVLDDEVLTGFQPIEELEAKIQKSFNLETKDTTSTEEQKKGE
ncbi:MAG: thioredoxin family protein [Candidatus Pacebacteria bacterium]|nr:thioredoxin family protein [Candidatus Paceibacterota bacterium]MBP9851417.1 thioredoxin family protein [Candidatus Paceibacterota bacterium]